MKKQLEKHFYKKVYCKYGEYNIYTTDQKIIKADIDTNKNEDKTYIFGCITFLLFIMTLIFIGIGIENSSLIMCILGGVFGLNLIIHGIIWLTYMHLYHKSVEIFRSFEESKEYQRQYKKIIKQEEAKKIKKLKKKADDLITVYDTLDDKNMEKEMKINIIKDYMKEDKN